MAVVTRIGPKFQVVIPKGVRDNLRLNVGDLVEATVSRDGVFLRPKVVVDRALEEAMSDVVAGRVSRSFRSARAFVRDLKGNRRRARKTY